MAQQTIGVGTAANDGTGDTVRAAFLKVNAMFTEIYAAVAALRSPVRTVAVALTAASGTPYPLTADDSVFSTVAAGAVAVLRTTNGQRIINQGAAALTIQAPANGTVNGAASVSIPAGGSAVFITSDAANFFAS